ncbi:hypothetical protein P9222_27205 [Paenibacillus amylolyticus]|nr:hypothetical protein [Paenibacillus amylolyticus]WFR61954.1 hypothetical protein P9222_27205 [Paenibacillus amylolyticus]
MEVSEARYERRRRRAPVLREAEQEVVEVSEAPILTAEGEKAPVLREVKQGAGQRAKLCP